MIRSQTSPPAIVRSSTPATENNSDTTYECSVCYGDCTLVKPGQELTASRPDTMQSVLVRQCEHVLCKQCLSFSLNSRDNQRGNGVSCPGCEMESRDGVVDDDTLQALGLSWPAKSDQKPKASLLTDEQKQERESYIRKGMITPCSGCDSNLTRKSGCKHLTCRTCKAETCALCLSHWKTEDNKVHSCEVSGVACPFCTLEIRPYSADNNHKLTCGLCMEDFCGTCNTAWNDSHLQTCSIGKAAPSIALHNHSFAQP